MRADNSIGVDDAIRGAARAFGDKPCLIGPDETLTFAEAGRAVDAAARDLAARGVGAGDRVALLDVNSVRYPVALGAIAALGAVAVPLNFRNREPEQRFQIEDSGAALLLNGRRYGDLAAALAPALALGTMPLDEIGRGTAPAPPQRPVSTRDPFAICYTSGTTGKPKGAVISQDAFLLRAYKLMLEQRLDATDVAHFTTPMFHVSCLIMTIMAIARGMTQLVLPQFDLEDTMAAVRAQRVTFMNTVPTILDMIVSAPDYTADAFGDLRLIMYTAAPMPLPLLRRVMADYRGGLVQFLGQTEDLPQTALTPVDHRRALAGEAHLLKSIGRPSMGVALKICDESGAEVAPGEIGEIVTLTGAAMSGYWNRPEETAETLRDGWVFSGDLGYADDEGYIYLAGRKKHMIIRGGENVYPAEVEQVLLTAPGVRDGVIVGVPDARWGEAVVAVVVAEEGAEESGGAAAIVAHCRAALASYKCPERVVFRDSLPYNAAGKVERHVLALDLAGPD